MSERRRTITGLRLLTVSLAKAGTGKNPCAGIVLAKAGVQMSPDEIKAALEALKTKLSDDEMALVMGLIEAGKQASPEVKPEVDAEPPEVAKARAEAVSKAHELIAKAEQERDLAKAELAKRDNEAALAGFVAKAKTQMMAIPGTTPAELGVLLKAVAEKVGDKEAAKFVSLLSGASAAIAKSVLLKSVGSGDDAVGTEAAKLRHEIALVRKARPELSDPQALVEVAKTNPVLFAAARKEEM